MGEHLIQSVTVHFTVGILHHDGVQRTARRFCSFTLPGSRIAEYQHDGREDVRGKLKQLPVEFTVFHDISDIAGTDAEAPGGSDGVLGGKGTVLDSKHQIACGGMSGGAAGITVSVIPFLAVGAEQKHQRRIGYEGLIITGNGQPLFQGRLCNLKDCLELLVTGGGSLAGSLKNCEAVFR